MKDLMFINVDTLSKKCEWFHVCHPFYFTVTDASIEISNVCSDILESIPFRANNVHHRENELMFYNEKEHITIIVKDNKIHKKTDFLPHKTKKLGKSGNNLCILDDKNSLYYKNNVYNEISDFFVRDDLIIVYKHNQLFSLNENMVQLLFSDAVILKKFYITKNKKFVVINDKKIILTDGTELLLCIDHEYYDNDIEIIIDQIGKIVVICNTTSDFTYIDTINNSVYEIQNPEFNLRTELDQNFDEIPVKQLCVCENYIYLLTLEKLYIYVNEKTMPIEVIENLEYLENSYDKNADKKRSDIQDLEKLSHISLESIKKPMPEFESIEAKMENTEFETTSNIEISDEEIKAVDKTVDDILDQNVVKFANNESNNANIYDESETSLNSKDRGFIYNKGKDIINEELKIDTNDVETKGLYDENNDITKAYNNLINSITKETNDLLEDFKKLRPLSYNHQHFEEVDYSFNTVLHELYKKMLNVKNNHLEKDMKYKLNLIDKFMIDIKRTNYNATLDYIDNFINNIGKKSFFMPYESVDEITTGIANIYIESNDVFLTGLLESMKIADEKQIEPDVNESKNAQKNICKNDIETLKTKDSFSNQDSLFLQAEQNNSCHTKMQAEHKSTQNNPFNSNQSVFGNAQQDFNSNQRVFIEPNPFLANNNFSAEQQKPMSNPFLQNMSTNNNPFPQQTQSFQQNNVKHNNPFINKEDPNNNKPSKSSALSKFANNHNKFI